MKVLCIIPARGGSKGIPRKNLYPLSGKPLLAYSIEDALETESINRVVVSTDDPAIADVAERYGAEVVRRPSEISGDTATSESALLHVLDHLGDTESYEPDLIVFSRPRRRCVARTTYRTLSIPYAVNRPIPYFRPPHSRVSYGIWQPIA